VGDKLREVFATGDLMITWRDEGAGVRRILYAYEQWRRGRSSEPSSTRLPARSTRHCCLRRPVIVRNLADAAALELFHFEGTDMSLSSVFRADVLRRPFSSARSSRELRNARTPSARPTWRLLSTVAASMGVALGERAPVRRDAAARIGAGDRQHRLAAGSRASSNWRR